MAKDTNPRPRSQARGFRGTGSPTFGFPGFCGFRLLLTQCSGILYVARRGCGLQFVFSSFPLPPFSMEVALSYEPSPGLAALLLWHCYFRRSIPLRVKGITMSNFTADEATTMVERGNKVSHHHLLTPVVYACVCGSRHAAVCGPHSHSA